MPKVLMVRQWQTAKLPIQVCGGPIVGILTYHTPEVGIYPENGESLTVFKQGSNMIKLKFKNFSLSGETVMGRQMRKLLQ